MSQGKSLFCHVVIFAGLMSSGTDANFGNPVRDSPPDHRFFLRQIFDKYGSGGIITFEGFEHLLENLGLGRLSFEKRHNVSVHRVNGSFLDLHDSLHLHDHNHGAGEGEAVHFAPNIEISPAEKEHLDKVDKLLQKAEEYSNRTSDATGKNIVKRNIAEDSVKGNETFISELCLSTEAILETFGLNPNHNVAITPGRFLHLCPAIVYQLDRKACNVQVSAVQRNVSRARAWLYATLSTVFIASVGLLAVSMVSLARRRIFLHFLIALAVGTLIGDALLHMLPHALLSEEYDHETIALRCSASFFAVVFFYSVESGLLLLRSYQVKRVSQSNKQQTLPTEMKTVGKTTSDSEGNAEMEVGAMLDHHGHSHDVVGGMSSLALLVIIGDGLHNFTDGLAIGASFSSDPVTGLATTIAVFCHELPHELGDFAVLLSSGMSVKRALFYNLVSSVLSFLGAGIGVWLGEIQNATHWIYALTAGTFLYIALADLIPEMIGYLKRDGKVRGIVAQLIGLTLGGIIMLVIALYEDKLHDLLA